MSKAKKDPRRFGERVRRTIRDMAALSTEAAAADPALRARLDAALNALQGDPAPERNTAVLANPADARAVVRDVVADELARYWDRRFGRTP